jgi:hypothetical protein
LLLPRYHSIDQIKEDEMGRADGENRNACRLLARKPEGKSYLKYLTTNGRVILKMALGELEWEGMD